MLHDDSALYDIPNHQICRRGMSVYMRRLLAARKLTLEPSNFNPEFWRPAYRSKADTGRLSRRYLQMTETGHLDYSHRNIAGRTDIPG